MNLIEKFSRIDFGWLAGRFAIVAVCISLVAPLSKQIFRYIDINYCGEYFKDSFWRHVAPEESWGVLPSEEHFDQRWLKETRNSFGVYRVAHALGGAGDERFANTIQAFNKSVNGGFRLFEVDISMDEKGNLWCRHELDRHHDLSLGPECRLESLLSRVDRIDGWLILDIKTDFVMTATRVFKVAQKFNLFNRLIFQLYSPDDVTAFTRMTKGQVVPEPIVTLYRSKRSGNYFINIARSHNIKVMAMDRFRINSLSDGAGENVTIFTHPVPTCLSWNTIRRGIYVRGAYSVSDLNINSCK